jgi:ABC-2 type transport system permease protein
MDKDSGIFYEMLTYPITRAQILFGKISFSVLVGVVGSALVVLLAVFALDMPITWGVLPMTAAVIAVATASWFFLFGSFAITLHRMDSFNTVTSAAYILLMFFSSMLYPLTNVPVWFRVIAYLNPMTWQVDLLRFGLLGAGERLPLVLEAAALLAFSVAGLGFSVRALNRAA